MFVIFSQKLYNKVTRRYAMRAILRYAPRPDLLLVLGVAAAFIVAVLLNSCQRASVPSNAGGESADILSDDDDDDGEEVPV